MKQLIVTVAVIVALIAVFVIIDRKDFIRLDDVRTVQSEPPISNRKPFVSIPETKPAAESMPAAESSFFTVSLFSYGENGKTIRNSEPVPAAVPVVTAEEADKLSVADMVIRG